MTDKIAHHVVLAFDFGLRRIGVAVGQAITQSATPLAALAAVDGVPDWLAISTLIQEWHATALVVGLPLNMDGTEQQITLLARHFGNTLTEKFKLPVYWVDERLTTVDAKQAIFEQKGKLSSRKSGEIDSYAAKLVLESWFSSGA